MTTATRTNGGAGRRPSIASASNRRSRHPAHAKSLESHHLDTSDHTAERIRAFMGSLQPLEDISIDRSYRVGVATLQRIAASAPPDEPTGIPTATLSGKEVTSVLAFLRMSEPRNPVGWWNEPQGGPSHMVGRDLVLSCLEDSVHRLSDGNVEPDTAPDAALTRLIKHLGQVTSKLDFVTNYWRTTENLLVEDHGAVGIVHDVGREVTALYGAISDWAEDHGLLALGPYGYLEPGVPLACAPSDGEDGQ